MIAQRTPTSGTAGSGGGFTVTLPAGTIAGDLVVVAFSNSGLVGPSVPSGWTAMAGSPWSSGAGHCVSAMYAPYSVSLTLAFTNAASGLAWACNAYFDAGLSLVLDGAPVAAHNTTANTTLPTGAPTTGAAAGDYEILVYGWNSATTISVVATGSTIDRTQVNGSAPTVALGHNNTNPLGASTTTTAFSQTLLAAQTRKTGVGVLLFSIASLPPVSPNAIPTAEQVYAPTLRVQVQPGAITTAEQVFAPTVVAPLPQTVQPGAIASAAQMYVPEVGFVIVLPPPPLPIGVGRAISTFPMLVGSAVSNSSRERVSLVVQGGAPPPVGTAVGGP